MPVMPLVASISTSPGLIAAQLACWIIANGAILHRAHQVIAFQVLTLYLAARLGISRYSYTSGVFPMHCSSVVTIFCLVLVCVE